MVSQYSKWQEKRNNLLDIFLQETSNLNKQNFNDYFIVVGNRHPQVLKDYLKGDISIETMIIFDTILNYKKDFDGKLIDPIWEMISMLNAKVANFSYRSILLNIKKH